MKGNKLVELKEGSEIPPDILKFLEKGFLKYGVSQLLINTKKISSVLGAIEEWKI